MLSRATPPYGFTLIEMMITVSIVAIVILLGAPSFFQWIQTTQIRSGAESMLTGVSLARVEALKRNAPVSFQMMDSLSGTCAHSATGPDWIVSVDDAAGLCDVVDPTATPVIIRAKPGAEGSRNAVYSAHLEGAATAVPTISFDALGRVTPTPAGNVVIDVTNPTGGACVAPDGGPMRCLTIQVTPGGQVRMCDPAVDPATNDPRSC